VFGVTGAKTGDNESANPVVTTRMFRARGAYVNFGSNVCTHWFCTRLTSLLQD